RAVMIHFDTLTSAYALQVLEGAEQAARRAEVDLLVVSGDKSADRSGGISRSWMAEIAARAIGELGDEPTPIRAQHARWRKDLSLPLIAIDPVTGGAAAKGVVTISATHREGGTTAVQHLLDLGHRRSGVLGGPTESVPARQRVQG